MQVYTSLPGSAVQRPVRELKGFVSVALAAGESREVAVAVRRADLAYWDIRLDGWVVEGGEYAVEVGASSRDIRSSASAPRGCAVTAGGAAVPTPITCPPAGSSGR